MNQSSLYNVGLTLLPRIGDVLIKQLVSYCGSAEAVYKESPGKLMKIPGIGSITVSNIKEKLNLHKAEKIIERAIKENTKLLFFTDDEFPYRLKEIDDAPCLIYYRGTSDLNHSKIISIVGTRKASRYGIDITKELVAQLSSHNPIILSGLAYGIDIAAHKAAVNNNLETIGVMASGMNIIYPYTHRPQAAQMLEHGGLITEFPFDEKPEMHNFPSRNRIIAGLSDTTIVVEAAKKGGALITAEIAYSYNKEVFAVPGELNKLSSEGCNHLIKTQKAQLITSADDIADALHWTSLAPNERQKQIEKLQLTEREKIIVTILNDKPITIDELGRKSQVPINALASDLLTLEFRSVVTSLPGNKYTLKN